MGGWRRQGLFNRRVSSLSRWVSRLFELGNVRRSFSAYRCITRKLRLRRRSLCSTRHATIPICLAKAHRLSCRHDRHPSQPLHPRHEPTPPHPPLTVSPSFPNRSFTYLKPSPTRTRTQRTPIDPMLHFAKNGDGDGMLIHALHAGIYA